MRALRLGIAAAGAVVSLFMTASVAVAQVSPLRLAVLPSARSGEVGDTLTFFGTIINTGEEALACREAVRHNLVVNGDDAEFVTVEVIPIDGDGAAIPFDGDSWPLAAGSSQQLLITTVTTGAISGVARTHIRCTTPSDPDAPVLTPIFFRGVNSFLVNFAEDPQPDIIVIGDTVTGDGVARVGETGPRAALLVSAAVNIGEPADLLVRPRVVGFSALNVLAPTVCETDANGVCLGPEADRAMVQNWATGEIRFFAVRLRVPPAFGIPFYPGQLRLAVEFGREAEPDAGDLSQHSASWPQSGHDELVWENLAGSDTAIEAFRGQAGLMFNGLQDGERLPYQCRHRQDHEVENHDGSRGNERNNFSPERHGAVFVSIAGGFGSPNPDGPITAVGYLGGAGSSQFGENRLYPVGFEGSANDGLGGTAPLDFNGGFTAFGGGGATTISLDVTQPGTLSIDPRTGGMTIVVEGDSGFHNSPFLERGVTRCALMPGPTGEASPATPETLEGAYDVRNSGDISPLFPQDYGFVTIITDDESFPDGLIIEGFFAPNETTVTPLNVPAAPIGLDPSPEQLNDPEFLRLHRGFATWPGALQGNPFGEPPPQSAPQNASLDVIGGLIPGRITGEGDAAAAECAVLFLRDMIDEPSEEERLLDARVVVLIREGSTLDLISAIRDCVP